METAAHVTDGVLPLVLLTMDRSMEGEGKGLCAFGNECVCVGVSFCSGEEMGDVTGLGHTCGDTRVAMP